MQSDMASYLAYLAGQWDMFEEITTIYNGKQYYFLQDDGSVYSRHSGKYLTPKEAYSEFMEELMT